MKDDMSSQRNVSHDELNIESLHINSDSSYSALTAAFQNMSKKAPSSTLSSAVLDSKKGVKRKLDFDADGSSDEDSTIRREKGKRICLGDFKRREHSFADSDSNTFSPSKNRRSATSYSRSSISSSCRRRLFPYDKKIEGKEMRSPLLQSKTDTKQKEIRLSLKKKFPGVPNSEFARSGLLLNLAFSKYNLPSNMSGSDKKSNVSYDFVDHNSANTTTRREFVHRSSIEKNNSSSFCSSPVFKSIKKVKRRLNLEEQESSTDTKETNEIVSKAETLSKDTNGFKINTDASAKLRCSTKETVSDKQFGDNSIDENRNSSRSSFSLSVVAKKPQPLNDLFKNSRLRLSLRNKIFDLSTCTANGSSTISNAGITDRNSVEADKSTAQKTTTRSSLHESSLSGKNSYNQRNKPKYDRIVVRKDLVDRAKKDAERLKRLSLLSSESLDIQKISRKISNGRTDSNIPKNVCCKSNLPSTFIEGHLKRFLKDCSEMAKLGLVSDECDSHEPMSGSLQSINFNQLTEIGDTELRTNSNMIRECGSDNNSLSKNNLGTERENSYNCIEDANSQDVELLHKKTEFTIENVRTQKNDRMDMHILDDTLNDDDLGEIGQKDTISSCSSSKDMNNRERNLKVEEVHTQESEFADNDCENIQLCDQAPITKETIGDSVEKKLSRKKRTSDTLCGRLHMLVNREKSEARIWEYELSKKEVTSGVNNGRNLNSPVLFCVEKMWKEFSRLIILCSRIDSDPSDEFFENNIMKSTGTNISHSVIVIIEPELFPKCATSSSIFRIHPPWRILYSAALNLQVIFRPSKVEIISANSKSLSYSDPTLPLRARTVVEKNHFCVCHDFFCDCVLPKQYVSVIPPLLSSFSNSNGLISLKSYVQEDVQSITGVDDLIIMYRLLYSKLHLEFEVLSMDSNFSKNAFGHVLGINDRAEKCCVLVKDKMENLPLVKVHMKVRFTGLIPWKIVPASLVSAFVKYLNLTRLELISKLASNDLNIFVLSGQYGRIDPV